MRIYVETNFIQELTLLHAESHACEKIMELCEGGNAEMVIPAFSIVEPVWKIGETKAKREIVKSALQEDRTQLRRTTGYNLEMNRIEEIEMILNRVIDGEQKRFEEVRSRLLNLATIIPLNDDIFERCNEFSQLFKKYTDTVVCASIISHLLNSKAETSCFLNKDAGDFLDPLVQQPLDDRNCPIFSGFGEGLGFILKSIA